MKIRRKSKSFNFLTWFYQIAAEIAAPLTNAKKVTMVSSGKGDVGALKLTNEVMGIMEKLPNVVENLTGINITKVRRGGDIRVKVRGAHTWVLALLTLVA